MAKERKTRVFLLALTAASAIGTAVYYRNAYYRELDAAENTIVVPPEKMREIRDTGASLMISYENGEKVVEIIRPEKH